MSIAVRVSGGDLKYARRPELVGLSQQGAPPPLAKTNSCDQANSSQSSTVGDPARCVDVNRQIRGSGA